MVKIIKNNIFSKFLFTIAFLLIISCTREAAVKNQPTKPQSVPSAAVWVGGSDGGVYVLLSKSSPLDKRKYSGEIYHRSGDLAYKGRLTLHPDNIAEIDVSDIQIYTGWDGDTLYLTEDRYMKSE